MGGVGLCKLAILKQHSGGAENSRPALSDIRLVPHRRETRGLHLHRRTRTVSFRQPDKAAWPIDCSAWIQDYVTGCRIESEKFVMFRVLVDTWDPTEFKQSLSARSASASVRVLGSYAVDPSIGFRK